MLKSITLQNFRSYSKSSFDFDSKSVVIIGPNTAGKSNLIESIFLLSSGKSFRAEKDSQMVKLGHEMGKIKARVSDVDLEVGVTVGEVAGVRTQYKRFFVNGVAKRRVDFVGNLPSVLFSPVDLEIVVGSPGLRRAFLDNVLEQTDKDYRHAHLAYIKGLRQRNALLEVAKDTGKRNEREFEYWDKLLIDSGSLITRKREEFVNYLNDAKKDIFNFKLIYDKSIISRERLDQYYDAETASGVTLVGPHRDDLFILFDEDKELKSFGSRGQQRLGVLQLKILELAYVEEKLGVAPLLLLDDVFSELDEGHINLILTIRDNQQTIITTTHEEFIPSSIKGTMEVIELDARAASSG
jgi:DNA replication and repair protein RecF